jgi:hypothetical protein
LKEFEMTPAVAVLDVCSEAAQANDAHAQIVRAERGTAALARKAGIALIAAQKRVGFGNWEAWLNANCPDISDRTAREYKRIARRWSELDRQRAAVMSIREAQAALAPVPTTRRSKLTVLPGQLALFQELPVEGRVPPPIPREETFEYKALLTRAARVFRTKGDKAEAIFAALSSHPALQ